MSLEDGPVAAILKHMGKAHETSTARSEFYEQDGSFWLVGARRLERTVYMDGEIAEQW